MLKWNVQLLSKFSRETYVLVKWSRVRLIISILTCEGLFATLRERLQFAPAPQKPPPAPPAAAVYDYAGALHIHSTYSDGVGTVEEIADAAGRAGLDYFVLCDHHSLEAITHRQDGWHGQTLVLVGTEITTDTGHLLAMNVPPEFLPVSDNAGEAQEAIADAGGVGFIALPCDLKDHWRNFALRRPGIGLEVFNLSAIARTKISLPGLVLVWLRYNSRRRLKAFNFVAARPARELALWDRLTQPLDPNGPYQPVVGIASLDAHAVMRFGGRAYPYPTYEESFRTLRTHVLTVSPLAARPAGSVSDARFVYRALAAGNCYMAYDNYADAKGFRFEAAPVSPAPGPLTQMGDSLTLVKSSRGVRLEVRAPQARSLVRLYRDGVLVAAARGGYLAYETRQTGAYRVEVYLYRISIGSLCIGAKPWIFSNPIYLQSVTVPADSSPSTRVSPARSLSLP